MKVFWIVLLSIAWIVSFLLPPDTVLLTWGITIGVPLFAIVRLIISKHVKVFWIVQLCIAWAIGVIILFADNREAAEWSFYILDGVSITAIVNLIIEAVRWHDSDDSDTQASSSRSADTPVYRENSSITTKETSNTWNCPTCGMRNKISYPRCLSCDTKNPYYTPETPPYQPPTYNRDGLLAVSINPKPENPPEQPPTYTRSSVDLSKNEPGSYDTSGAADIVFCRKCGTKMPGDSLFCPKCGSRIS